MSTVNPEDAATYGLRISPKSVTLRAHLPANHTMLSYRHAYHAGNFADILKHVTIIAILRHLLKKEGAIQYLDTHAGAGSYDLASEQARKTQEYTDGIERLWSLDDLPPLLRDYKNQIGELNQGHRLQFYPGSPWFAARTLRPKDKLALCELHTSDFPLLQKQFKGDRRVRCFNEDGYQRSLAMVPPASKRGLIVIDPSYEVKTEYQKVVTHIQALHKRFATGVYALWYPVIDAGRLQQLEYNLRQTGIKRIQLFEFGLDRNHNNQGMNSAGMVVVNPPWTLRAELEENLQWLIKHAYPNSDAYWRFLEIAGE